MGRIYRIQVQTYLERDLPVYTLYSIRHKPGESGILLLSEEPPTLEQFIVALDYLRTMGLQF